MTGRERLENILNGLGSDGPAWTTLADDTTRSAMAADVRAIGVLDFYRRIGCDILQFGNYGLPDADQARPARLVRPAEIERTTDGDGVTERTVTPWGVLTASRRHGHPVTYPVASLDDLRILTHLWRQSRYEETPGAADACRRADRAVGPDGLYLPTLDPSPVQQLIETDMSLAGFYYFAHDYPHEMADLMAEMHRCRCQEYEIVARLAPNRAMIAVENTSSTLTSPDAYRQYTLPHIRDYARIAHSHGVKLILHMCGLLKALLPALAETGMDGVNGLTPPPVGDCAFETALDALGEDLVILGGVLPGSVFHAPGVTADDIAGALDGLYTPRVRRANFLLWAAADGLPTPLWKFHAVADWMRRNGRT